MRIIVIIAYAVPGLGFPLLLIGFLYLLMFTSDGDRVIGAQNVIERDSLCYRTPEQYHALEDVIKTQKETNTLPATKEQADVVLNNIGITRVLEGESVTVLKGEIFIIGEGTLTPVLFSNGTTGTCYVRGNVLEMTLFQWIMWRVFS